MEEKNQRTGMPENPDISPKTPPQRQKKGGRKPWLIPVIIAAVLLILGGGFGTGFAIYNIVSSAKETISSQPDSSQLSDGGESEPEESSSVPEDSAGFEISRTPDGNTSLPEDGSGRLTSVQIAQKVTPSVVAIMIYQNDESGKETPLSFGSGIIMSEDGYILTCSHVVKDGNVNGRIEVIFSNNAGKADARIIGVDTQTDLAVIKIEKTGLPKAEFGDSAKTVVGQPVYVIGTPSDISYLGSFAGGFVSAVDREVLVGTQKYKLACIQTDAAINPGNSGGPLINEYGQVIGINSAKLVSTNVEGIGFAIPSDTAQAVVASLMESGYVTGRPKIGITFTAISSELAQLTGIPQGIRVVGISEDCDVAAKDVQIGDIITAIDGTEVSSLNEIAAVINRKKPGDSVTLSIYRVEEDGSVKTFDVGVMLSEKTE